MEIVQISGDVLEVVDEMRDLPVKDKDGTEVVLPHHNDCWCRTPPA